MTIIVWTGQHIAADKLSEMEGLKRTTCKLKRVGAKVLAIVGEHTAGLGLFKWYEEGADPEKYPKRQETDDWTRLIVADAQGCVYYERTPWPVKVEDPFSAWGSGRDIAMGALAMGADARRAVEITCEFYTNCGLGVDVIDLGAR